MPFDCCYSSVKSCLTLWPHELQGARLSCPSPSPGMYSNSCPLSQWCHPTISSSGVPFSSCLQSFPASGSFPMSWLFASCGQSFGASALESVLPMNIQGWFPLGLIGMVSLQFTGLSRVFFDTRAGKHQLFGAQPSLCVCVYPLMKVKEESEKASLKLNIQKTKIMISMIISWK